MTLFVLIELANSSNLLTSITYNGVAMTLIQGPVFDGTNGNGPSYFSTYALANPSTGANNVVVTFSANVFVVCVSLSYSGTNTSTQPDGTTTGTNANPNTSDVTGTITTTTAGDWGIMMVGAGRPVVVSTGSTLRYTFSNNQGIVCDSGGAFASVGSNSMAYHSTASGGGNGTYIMAGVNAAGATVVHSLMSMGMGS